MAKLADLDALAGLGLGNAVEVSPFRAIEDEDRKRTRRELGPAGPEPTDDLALGNRAGPQPAEQLSRPGARGQNQRARLVTATLGFDLDAVSDRLPAAYWLILAHVGPKF